MRAFLARWSLHARYVRSSSLLLLNIATSKFQIFSEGFGGDCVYHLQNHVVRALLEGSDLENLAAEYLPVIEAENAIYASADAGARIQL